MVGDRVDTKLLAEVSKKEELYINAHKDRAKTNCVLALQDGCQCQCGGISHAYLYNFHFMTHSGECSSQMKKFISVQLDQAGRDLGDEEKRITTIQKTKH